MDEATTDEEAAEAQAIPETPDPDEALRERKHWDAITIQNQRARKAENAWNDLKTKTALAKKQYEGLISEVSNMIAGGPETPLFDEPQEAAALDAWRKESVRDALASLPDGLLGKLEDAGLVTMGDLSDWQNQKGDFWAKDIKGVGPAAAEKISDAMTDFWAEHPTESDTGESEVADLALVGLEGCGG